MIHAILSKNRLEGLNLDNLTPEQRHKNMTAIKSKDSDIELLLRRELWKKGLRYRKNVKSIYGHPDIAFISKKIAVFCDSEFWHGYEWEKRKQTLDKNKDYWIKKIERNMARDREVNERLTLEGWKVIRFWGKEIKKSTSTCIEIIEKEYYKE